MARTAYTGKWRTAAQLEAAWEEYKEYCNNRKVIKTGFSQKDGFVTSEVPSPVTYTIKGFALYNHMTERNFYATYREKEKFKPVIERMKDECEQDAREKFEQGAIESKLAGIWMANDGYTTNINQMVDMEQVIIVDDMEKAEPKKIPLRAPGEASEGNPEGDA